MNREGLFTCKFLIALTLILVACGKTDNKVPPPHEGITHWQYFGLSSPGAVPQIFSPEIISTRRNERDMTMSPAGNVMFYSLVMPANNLNVVLFLQFDGFFWSEPEVAAFSGIYNDLEPSYSPDGKKFFFISKRPLTGRKEKSDWDIWFLEPEKGWTNPVNLGAPVNTDKDEYYPSLTSSGNLYFTANYDDSFGEDDIYCSQFIGGKYQQPVNLGDSVNSAGYDFNAFISPDESYLLFSSFGRPDEKGGGDLYISYRRYDGTWTKSKNLGTRINSDRLDYCPFVTSDGKYLFFTSQRESVYFRSNQHRKLVNLLELADGIENGSGNIYWVDFDKNAWK